MAQRGTESAMLRILAAVLIPNHATPISWLWLTPNLPSADLRSLPNH